VYVDTKLRYVCAIGHIELDCFRLVCDIHAMSLFRVR